MQLNIYKYNTIVKDFVVQLNESIFQKKKKKLNESIQDSNPPSLLLNYKK